MEILGGECPAPFTSFEDAKFPRHVLSLFKRQGYTKPTAIQAQGWALAMSGKDMIASAETGSGKTVAFLLPAFEHISKAKNKRCVTVLVLAPTRELALQIHEDAKRMALGYDVTTACLHGGQSNRNLQYRQLLQKPALVVATPGRLLDFIEQGALTLRNTDFVVLDEADRMLDMGFEEDVREIMGMTSKERQTLMWSATWPKKVQNLASSFLTNPVRIRIGSDEVSANKNVTQKFIFCERHEKIDKLKELMEDLGIKKDFTKTLIFTETKMQADILANTIETDGFLTDSLHGDKPQSQRNNILESYKRGRFNVLIATDVASRGIDIADISVVINYSLPKMIDHYVHRIGRTGRAGRKGVAYSFFVPSADEPLTQDIVKVMTEADQPIPPELNELASRRPRSNNFSSTSSSNKFASKPRRLYEMVGNKKSSTGGRSYEPRTSSKFGGGSSKPKSWSGSSSSRGGSRWADDSPYSKNRSRWSDDYDY